MDFEPVCSTTTVDGLCSSDTRSYTTIYQKSDYYDSDRMASNTVHRHSDRFPNERVLKSTCIIERHGRDGRALSLAPLDYRPDRRRAKSLAPGEPPCKRFDNRSPSRRPTTIRMSRERLTSRHCRQSNCSSPRLDYHDRQYRSSSRPRLPSPDSRHYRSVSRVRGQSPDKRQRQSSPRSVDRYHRSPQRQHQPSYHIDSKRDVYTSCDNQLFLAVTHTCVGLMVGTEYDIFYTEKRSNKKSVIAKSSWALQMAMYPTGSTSETTMMCVSRYVIHRYSATKEFILNTLKQILKSNFKLYSTPQSLKNMDKMFCNTDGYDSIKDRIKYLESKRMTASVVLKPQRRSSVCLFRGSCEKNEKCVYCLLEALNNHINIKKGIRATKLTDVGEKDRGVLDRIVSDVASRTGTKSMSSASSSSSSSSSSSASSSESSTDEEPTKDKKRKTPPPSSVQPNVHESCEDVLKIDTDNETQ